MMRRLFYFSFVCGLLLSPILVSSTSYALDSRAESGFKKGIKNSGGTSSSNVGSTIQNAINILLYIAGIIAVIYVVVGGFRYVLSNGDSGAITKAKNTIIYALIGLAVVVMAYAIVNFVLDNIVQP